MPLAPLSTARKRSVSFLAYLTISLPINSLLASGNLLVSAMYTMVSVSVIGASKKAPISFIASDGISIIALLITLLISLVICLSVFSTETIETISKGADITLTISTELYLKLSNFKLS